MSKIILYYFHERFWFKSSFSNPNKRHLLKTISWRTVGTLDTLIISAFVTGSPLIGLKIGFSETMTKMILYYFHEKIWYKFDYGLTKRITKKNRIIQRSLNIEKFNFSITRKDRAKRFNQKQKLLWFTGLSGSGKSTLSDALEKKLFNLGFSTYSLDGDNVRSGINVNLGFDHNDRSENIRRVGEVSKILLDAGLIITASFVSPFQKDRDLVRKIVGCNNFIEIYVSTPLKQCEKRDVKGLYKKARNGEIRKFTGISSPYEIPNSPDLEIDTSKKSIHLCVKEIIEYILPKIKG